jgi:aspartyl/glutamyl-tRNA(Asn/Gln) amidotransferase C subunit
VDTKNINPVSQVTGLVNVLRDDVVENCDEDAKNIMIKNYPQEKGGYIKVKQVR